MRSPSRRGLMGLTIQPYTSRTIFAWGTGLPVSCCGVRNVVGKQPERLEMQTSQVTNLLELCQVLWSVAIVKAGGVLF